MSEVTKIRCSSLPRLAACPGSLKACEGLESKSSAVSEMGSRIHAAIESYYIDGTFVDVGVSERDLMVVRWFTAKADELIASHGGSHDVYPEFPMRGIIADGVEITGHADLIVRCNDGKWLLFDWKCGYAEVPKAAANIQLMGYAWLLSTNEGMGGGIEAYLFSAGSKDAPLSGTMYDRDSIGMVKQKLTDIVQSAVLRDVRNPGDDQCRYCQAKCSTRCPETLESLAMPPIVRECLLPANKDEAAALRKAAKSFIALAESYVERIDAEVRAYPDEWKDRFVLQSTGRTRKVESAQEAYRVIVEENCMLSAAEFLALVTVPIGNLEVAMKPGLTAHGVPVKDQKALVATMLGDNLKLEEKAMSVKAVVK